MNRQKRWVLLAHTGLLEDPENVHFDLLLEDRNGCRSWRLEAIPVLDGPAQSTIPLPVHRLAWLDISGQEVSGGRGWARRVFAGFFYGELPKDERDPVQIELSSKEMIGNLEIRDCLCKLSSVESSFK